MNEADMLQWLGGSWLGEAARNLPWVWPTFETLHFLGLCTLFGALMVVDLRVLGVGKHLIPVDRAMRFVPIALVGFVLTLLSGVTFFCADPINYWSNHAFRAKMGLIVFGGINALAFELLMRRRLLLLPLNVDAGRLAKMVAAASLCTWIVVMTLGRLLPYTGSIG